MITHFGQAPEHIPGFLFSGVHCGIKENGKKDLALMVSEADATTVAGVFTQNAFAAGPVLVCKANLKASRFGRVVVANSGNANAGLGKQSLKNAEATQKHAAERLSVPKKQVFVSSTGKIGIPLPLDKLTVGIDTAFRELSPVGFADAAEAIMTTDKSKKVGFITGTLAGKAYTLAAMAKGAGMISPAMATMLGYAFTDLAIQPRFLQSALRRAVRNSFNRTSVDGDMSTNDTALILANGRAGNRVISGGKDGARFEAELTTLFSYLAREMVLDGEGATACMTIVVKKARSPKQAEAIARAIGNSPLVKCAIYGRDPNWGRILSAAGAADFSLNPNKVALSIADTLVFKNGAPTAYSESAIANTLKAKTDIPIVLTLNQGQASAQFIASDLSVAYVQFNSAYRT